MFKFFTKKQDDKEQPVDRGEVVPASSLHPSPPSDQEGFFSRLRAGLSKTRNGFTGRLDRLFLGKKEITQDLLEELEEILFTSDIGVATTQELIAEVQAKVARKELKDPQKLKEALKGMISAFLEVPPRPHTAPLPGEPLVIMVVGVNGVGKTTTIAKAAHRFRSEGKSVILVAADTFRAAAVEQLSIWGERAGVPVIKQQTGADPSAVAFDGVAAALGRKADVVLIDTAGRLHTRTNLMEELQKINRVIGKKLPGAPHEVWLVLDATTGQNAISQAQLFNEAVRVTHIVLTKLDGTAKGGIVVGISKQLAIPIKLIGIGERMDDLRPFVPRDFVQAIFE
ncbi:signal recognition particle-docking protein FtsY [Desulfatiglans anilini]|uniref:signal recognition particle-docking protein FtsY n=1 Tax=Desulfatiglans anilini TaxID=90728 RepID=UPI000410A69E|nr:signal recognition particle-docking protein FtsY [Desulfatiglans anilini]